MAKGSKRRNEPDSEEEQVAEGETVDVSFTFTGPHSLDFHSVKHLLTQLLSDLFPSDTPYQYSDLADLIITQKQVGNFVRVADNEDEDEDEDEGDEKGEGEEKQDSEMKDGETEEDDQYPGDPYGFLTLLDISKHSDNQAIVQLLKTLTSHCPSTSPLHTILSSPPPLTGIILGERVLNMPLEIVPHLYRLLDEDLSKANQKFKNLIFLSRVFVPSSSSTLPSLTNEPEDPQPVKKKKKKSKSKPDSNITTGPKDEEMFSYHPESVFIASHATSSFTTPVLKNVEKHEDGLSSIPGVENAFRVMIVPGDKWKEVVSGIEGFMTSSG